MSTFKNSWRAHRLAGLLLLTLALLTFLTFFGVWRNGFVDYDDNFYVFRNHNITRPLDWQTVTWAFTRVDDTYSAWSPLFGSPWTPLVWLSYIVDFRLFGLNPAGYHATNLLLHIANVLLLFLALRSLTGSLWQGAMVAALFGVHPLRVESVAWVAERKDVLSGFFFMLTLLAYATYAKSGQRSTLCRLAALSCFALGLMSKPMLVTVPVVLLLLDFWPLRRFPQGSKRAQFKALRALLLEKWPFIGLSALFCLITLAVRKSAAERVGGLPLGQRLGNGALACVTYLGQTFWPAHLSVFYPPKPVTLLSWSILGALALVLACSALAVLLHRRYSFAVVGWFWYLVTLLPVSGILQPGAMIQADHYTYLPSIGILILLVWGVAAACSAAGRHSSALLGLASTGALILLSLASHRQVAVWRNTETLFSHAVSVTRTNYVALTSLAGPELERGQIAAAMTNLEQALVIFPKYPRAEYLVGEALQMQGRMQEAIPHLEAAFGPEVGLAGKARLVLSLLDAGRLSEAQAALDELQAAQPHDPMAAIMRAALFKEQGRLAEATQLFRQVLVSYSPPPADNPTLNFELAELYSLDGRSAQAVRFYSKAVKMGPSCTNALNNFSWLLATDPDDNVRNGPRAVELAERACELTRWSQPQIMGTLAAAYAEAGRFDEAVSMAGRARDKAREQGLEDLVKKNAELLELYRQHKPYRETPG